MDDYQADDMKHGDLDILTLRNRFRINVDEVSTKVNPHTLKLKNPADPFAYYSPYVHPEFQPKAMKSVSREESAALMFDEFRELAKMFSFHGEYQDIITDMITHMQKNTGEVYRNPLLDKALKEQILNDHSENSTLLKIKDILKKNIDFRNSVYPAKEKGKFKDGISEQMILPKFNRWLDRTNGLVISVHDTWSTYIILESLIIYNNSWKARIRYRIQDHFGLDDNDITHSLYKHFRIFRLWFSLQRWNEYGYKPFITEIDAIIEINGLEYE